MTVRAYLEIAAAVVLAIAFGLYTWHERTVGAEHISQADAKAQDAAKRQADAETALNLERAAKADAGAVSAQKAVDDYVAKQPIDSIWLCANNRLPVPSEGSSSNATAQSAGTGSAPVREVQNRDAPINIGPNLNELVLSASRMAVLYNDLQQR